MTTLIRRAQKQDWEHITSLLEEMDLTHDLISMHDFWVALEDDEIVGIAQLKSVYLRVPSTSPSTQQVECSASLRMRGRNTSTPHLFLTAVGVHKGFRKRGIATALLKDMLSCVDRDVYLFTIIPEFFEKLGFVKTASPFSHDFRKHFYCEECAPDRCVCMRKSGRSGISCPA